MTEVCITNAGVGIYIRPDPDDLAFTHVSTRTEGKPYAELKFNAPALRMLIAMLEQSLHQIERSFDD